MRKAGICTKDRPIPFPDSEKDIQEMEVEYSRLFIGPYHVIAPPYSSVYLDEQPRVMGESTQVAINFYVKAGLNPNKENKEPPDHISTELEFMYYLLFQFLETGEEQYNQLKDNFMDEHLIHWVPVFVKTVQENAKIPFYQKLSEVLGSFIGFEAN